MKSQNSHVDQGASRAAANEDVQQQKSMSGADGVAQLSVSASATYKPTKIGVPFIKALDAKISDAEVQATKEVTGKIKSATFINTPTQTAYMNNPSAAGWGSCVEEQLNPVARNMGWSTQVPLNGSRPDYGRVASGKTIFADLTTNAEAGYGGNHITSKLLKARSNGDDDSKWEAADITHSGSNPLSGAVKAPLIKTNGNMTQKQMKRYQVYYDYCNNSGGFHQGLENVRNKYGKISRSTYSQKWGSKERQAFGQDMLKAGF